MLKGFAAMMCGAQAQDEAGAERKLALRICGACHTVAKVQRLEPAPWPGLEPPALNLSTLARGRGFTEEYLRKLLASRHWDADEKGQMPNPELLDYQIDRLVAYFASLRKK